MSVLDNTPSDPANPTVTKPSEATSHKSPVDGLMAPIAPRASRSSFLTRLGRIVRRRR